jgi:phage baseplate assembly protein W
MTSDIVLQTDVAAVKQSVMNILMTNKGEKVFDDLYGGNLRSYLFELWDSITSAAIKARILSTLTNYEPRIQVTNIDVDDTRIDANALTISIDMIILSPVEVETTVEFIVERIR